MSNTRPIGIYYEHPDWFRPLFAELDRRGTPYVKIPAERHSYDPAQRSAADFSTRIAAVAFSESRSSTHAGAWARAS